MTAIDETGVIRRLEAAAADAEWPASPDLRASVMTRLAGTDAPPAPDLRDGVLGRIRGARSPRRSLRPLLLAATLLLAVAGVAAGLGYGLPGVDIERVAETPAAGIGLDLGTRIPLADALARTAPRVLAPDGIRAPDTAWVLGRGDETIVTLAWRTVPGEASIPGSDLSLSLMAAPGSIDEPLLRKTLGPGTRVEAVDVNGDRGWWITGAPHEILVVRPGGDVGVVRAALAGDTLVFFRDGTLYRLESALGRDTTLEIARSMR
jgi:hypothetical protein